VNSNIGGQAHATCVAPPVEELLSQVMQKYLVSEARYPQRSRVASAQQCCGFEDHDYFYAYNFPVHGTTQYFISEAWGPHRFKISTRPQCCGWTDVETFFASNSPAEGLTRFYVSQAWMDGHRYRVSQSAPSGDWYEVFSFYASRTLAPQWKHKAVCADSPSDFSGHGWTGDAHRESGHSQDSCAEMCRSKSQDGCCEYRDNGYCMFKTKKYQREAWNFLDTYSFEVSGSNVDCTPPDWCSYHDMQQCERYFKSGWQCTDQVMKCCPEQCKSECGNGSNVNQYAYVAPTPWHKYRVCGDSAHSGHGFSGNAERVSMSKANCDTWCKNKAQNGCCEWRETNYCIFKAVAVQRTDYAYADTYSFTITTSAAQPAPVAPSPAAAWQKYRVCGDSAYSGHGFSGNAERVPMSKANCDTWCKNKAQNGCCEWRETNYCIFKATAVQRTDYAFVDTYSFTITTSAAQPTPVAVSFKHRHVCGDNQSSGHGWSGHASRVSGKSKGDCSQWCQSKNQIGCCEWRENNWCMWKTSLNQRYEYSFHDTYSFQISSRG